jgi:hypothetical protein
MGRGHSTVTASTPWATMSVHSWCALGQQSAEISLFLEFPTDSDLGVGWLPYHHASLAWPCQKARTTTPLSPLKAQPFGYDRGQGPMSLKPFPVASPLHRAPPIRGSPSSASLGRGTPLAALSPGVAEAAALFSPIRGATPGLGVSVGAGAGITFGNRSASSALTSTSARVLTLGSPSPGTGATGGGSSSQAFTVTTAPTLASPSSFGGGGVGLSREAMRAGRGAPGPPGSPAEVRRGGGELSVWVGDSEGEEEATGTRTPSGGAGAGRGSCARGRAGDLTTSVAEGSPSRRAVGAESVVAPYLAEVLPRLVTDLIPDVPRSNGPDAKRLGALVCHSTWCVFSPPCVHWWCLARALAG